jgi:Na+-transporting NADH:ubiquinone oxidoreductase subunit NqrA
MFGRTTDCGGKHEYEKTTCQRMVEWELVDHETGIVLARKFDPCPRHQPGQAAVNLVDERTLQDQAVKFLVAHPELFPRCEKCWAYLTPKKAHVCAKASKWERKEPRKNAKH